MDNEKKQKRPRGSGGIYRRGNIYWIKYYRNGKPHVESSHSDQEVTAKNLLRLRQGEIAKGELPGVYFEKVFYDELAEALERNYRINGKRTQDKLKTYLNHLREHFGGKKAVAITTDEIQKYIEKKQAMGYKNASINRELACLKTMFRLALRSTPPKVRYVPYMPLLEENNTREGFFEYGEYIRVKECLPSHLKPVALFGYYAGWRWGEVVNLIWDRVDFNKGAVWLSSHQTKNKQAREIYPETEVMEELKRLYLNRRIGCPYVFTDDGRRISKSQFHREWTKACCDAGLKGKLFHDFRRTAVRELIRSGVPQPTAMLITGHKSTSVFNRYNIVSDQDLKDARDRREQHIKSQETPSGSPREKVTALVTVGG
jgi:integrase